MIQKAFFLPNKNCPRRCVYCDQHAITGKDFELSPDYVKKEAGKYSGREKVEICFFGGSFTCLPQKIQKIFMDSAIEAGQDNVIRFSTHPLCFNDGIFEQLAKYPISMIELGVSSLDNRVLERCRRGYKDHDVIQVLRILSEKGYNTGVQLMIGLPLQSEKSSLDDIERLSDVMGNHALTLRIYPCLILRNTELELMFQKGEFIPLTLEKAVEWAGKLHNLSVKKGFRVQRIGLHETPSLEMSVVAGPHHPSFGELARGFSLAMTLHERASEGPWEIDQKEISMLRGHKKHGLRILSRLSGLGIGDVEERIIYKASDRLPGAN